MPPQRSSSPRPSLYGGPIASRRRATLPRLNTRKAAAQASEPSTSPIKSATSLVLPDEPLASYGSFDEAEMWVRTRWAFEDETTAKAAAMYGVAAGAKLVTKRNTLRCVNHGLASCPWKVLIEPLPLSGGTQERTDGDIADEGASSSTTIDRLFSVNLKCSQHSQTCQNKNIVEGNDGRELIEESRGKAAKQPQLVRPSNRVPSPCQESFGHSLPRSRQHKAATSSCSSRPRQEHSFSSEDELADTETWSSSAGPSSAGPSSAGPSSAGLEGSTRHLATMSLFSTKVRHLAKPTRRAEASDSPSP